MDRWLARCFALFGFVALVFEPLYYFGCSWNGESCEGTVSRIWRIYSRWDPLFYRMNVPELLWLRVMCSIEVFLFGPCYLLTAGSLYHPGHAWSQWWLRVWAQPFLGALVYSTLVYFAMEHLLATDSGANMLMVFIVNGPWTAVPCCLLFKLNHREKQS